MSGGRLDERDELRKPSMDWRLLARIWPYLRPKRALLFGCLAATLAGAALDLAAPLLLRRVIDTAITPPWLLLEHTAADHVPQEAQEKWLAAPDGRWLAHRRDLPRVTRNELDARGLILPQRYAEIPAAEPVPGALLADGHAFLDTRGFSKLDKARARSLRSGDLAAVHRTALLWGAILVAGFLFNLAVTFGLSRAGHTGMAKLREDLYAHLLKLPARFFQNEPLGRLVTRVANDVNSITELVTQVLVFAVKDVVLFLGVLGVLAVFDLRLTAAILLLAPPVTLAMLWLRAKLRDAFREVRALLARINGFLQESLSGMEAVTAFRQEARMNARLRELNERHYAANLAQIKWMALFRPLVDLAASLALAVLIWYGGLRVLDHQFTIGGIVAGVVYLEMLFLPVRDLTEKWTILQGAMTGAERVFGLMDLEQEPNGARVRPLSAPPAVHFERVRFAYRAGEDVLKNVNLEIPAGSTAALAGATGSGKSTLLALLQGFEVPADGSVEVDGTPVAAWDRRALRAGMAVVLQDVSLFSGTLAENITLGRPLREGNLERAVEAARLKDILHRFPDGLQTRLAEDGKGLSAGERQLISFARALAHDPWLILLDEATAAMDSETERLVQEGMRSLLEGRTALVIAHRLATIRNADCIHVLQDGELVESGNHGTLTAHGGLYARLVRLQQLEESLRT